jgi:hypothetical protein
MMIIVHSVDVDKIISCSIGRMVTFNKLNYFVIPKHRQKLFRVPIWPGLASAPAPRAVTLSWSRAHAHVQYMHSLDPEPECLSRIPRVIYINLRNPNCINNNCVKIK